MGDRHAPGSKTFSKRWFYRAEFPAPMYLLKTSPILDRQRKWRGSWDTKFNEFWIADFRLGESNMTQIFQANLLSFRSDNPKSKIKNLKWWGIFAIAFALAFGGAVALAQQPGKLPQIGVLYPGFSGVSDPPVA